MSRDAEAGSGAEGPSVEAVDRAVRVLNALAARPIASTLSEAAVGAGLSKPTAYRILSTLIAEGFVAQNASSGAYRLGAAPLRLAARVLRDVTARDPALEAMRKIRAQVKETVVLSVREGDYRYNIDSVEAENAIGQAQQIGVAIPLHAGAASRVLLAGMESEDLLSYLDRAPLTRFSETTIVERDKLIEELARTRQLGYAVSSGEFASAGHAVAMAVSDANGRAIAALHVSAPRSRFSPTVRDRCVAALRLGVAEIEAAMAV